MSDHQHDSDTDSSCFFSMTRALALQALELSLQEWGSLLDESDDAYDNSEEEHDVAADDDDANMNKESLQVGVERVTSLLLVRLVAIAAPPNTYSDLSTSTICRDYLSGDDDWSSYVSLSALQELIAYVAKMLSLHRDLPFHNFLHSVHVCVSANKLLEFILSRDFYDHGRPRPPTFGLRDDPVALAALLFAALIHDVDHAGVSNRQRCLDEPQLALLYNDQSISENHSLHLAFQELLVPTYLNFYNALVPTEHDYQRFRKLVVDSVLSTDLASPERTQISKSRWKEAFGISQQQRQQQLYNTSNHGVAGGGRRGSMTSQVSMHRANKITTNSNLQQQQDAGRGRMKRRGSSASISSIVSDVTTDSYNMLKSPSRNNHHVPIPTMSRRLSNGSIDSMGDFSDMANDSVVGKPVNRPALTRRLSSGSDQGSMARRQSRYRPSPSRGVTNNNSGISYDSMAQMPGFADDSMRVQQRQYDAQRAKQSRRHSMQSYQSHDTYTSSGFKSVTANSIVLAQKRGEGARRTRPSRYTDGSADDKDLSNHSLGHEQKHGRKVIQYAYNGSEHDEDSSESLSLTPPSSDDEEPIIISGIPRVYAESNRAPATDHQNDVSLQKTLSIDLDATGGAMKPRPATMRGVARRASTGNLPMRFGSLVGSTIDEHEVSEHTHKYPVTTDTAANGTRRMSLNYSAHSSGSVQNFKKRLGVRRSMDLSGESVEIYPRRGSGEMSVRSTFTEMNDTKGCIDYDEPDDLKLAVVIEVLLRASDVAHNLQYFGNQWRQRLYKELLLASDAGKGFDPRPGWFDNQCRVIEGYMMPLAAKLNEMGVFGSEVGLSFSDILENNLDSWMVEGMDLQQKWDNFENPMIKD